MHEECYFEGPQEPLCCVPFRARTQWAPRAFQGFKLAIVRRRQPLLSGGHNGLIPILILISPPIPLLIPIPFSYPFLSHSHSGPQTDLSKGGGTQSRKREGEAPTSVDT